MPAPSGRLSRRYQATVSGVVYRSARPVPAGQNNHGEALGLIRSGPDAGMPDLQIMFVDVPLRAETLPGPASPNARQASSRPLGCPYRNRIGASPRPPCFGQQAADDAG
jgi:hypothetical protein